MSGKLLNLFLRFSGFIFNLKQKIVDAKSWTQAFPFVILLLLTELVFLIVSLPLYLVVSPKKLQESGFIFPSKEKEPEHFHIYLVRRKISLATIFGAGGIVLLKFIFIGLVSAYLLGAQALLAASQDWNFNTAGDYTYDGAKISVSGGVAQLVDQGGGGSCGGTATACTTFVSSPTCTAQAGCSWGGGASGATANPSFDSGTTGWTYADWETGNRASGTRITSGGNPNAYINIALTAQNNNTASGYWRQSFSTTAANPTATVNFDWKITSYSSTGLTSFIIYVFVDSTSGAPTIGNQVWSQTITSATNWASVANLDVSSKVPTAGTYYVKVVARRITGSGASGTNTVGFDNVQLNWSKTDSCSGTATACNTYVSSPTCVAQGGCSWTPVAVYPTDKPSINPTSSLVPSGVTSWNSFTETATKGTGEIYYQLSDDDGATWKYWNGSWVTVATSTDYNTDSVVNTNINTFSASAGKIMWKAFLSSDGSQQITLDNIAISYTQNAAPVLQSVTASQNTATGYVHVDYNLRDDNNDPNSLTTYEYSLTGAFTGEQSAMTPVPSDPAHDGISGLNTSASGVAHTFVWNAAADLGNVFFSTVYVRLRANDGIVNSNYIISSPISVDYVNPVVSSVTAVQASSSANVIIGYNLSDDTTNDILVELQASSDNGATWDVPVSSVSGDVGASVTSGNGKTITWNAGSDFANQENNNMMVRVRAKDKYQNQGANVDSSSFVIDNRAPVIATPVDLLAQPLAGATTALVGGSFSEGNPNTNNFYIAIDGGSYGSAQAGDSDTATPSDKSLSVGTTLKGNNYISSVKIEHTDDFGLMTANENTSPNSAYKYVKPYTPPAPTISNPAESGLDVTINKNINEVDGLEYAIFESTQNLYVQSDGSLGSGAYWQPIGIVTVTGLSQPISQYSFKVKSRNSSDVSNAITSESDLSSGASSDYASPSILINDASQMTNGSKVVDIGYIGIDPQNHTNDLVLYEYSTDGANWGAMTPKPERGDGVSNLAFTSGGANFGFSWDVGTDLSDIEDSSIYVRLQSSDNITNSNLAVSGAFNVDTKGPVVSNIQASQTIGTNNVIITYDLADGAGANSTVVLTVSDDSGATYNVLATHKTGDVGAGVTAGLARAITWDVGADLADQEKTTMRVKIAATDSYGNEGAALESTDFAIDTKAPVVSDVTASQVSGSALVTVNYNLADLNNSNVEFNISADSGFTWTIATTTYTGDVGPGQTAGSKTFDWNAVVDYPDQELDTMRVRVRALDTFGHQGGFVESADFSVNTKVLSISDITAAQIVGTKTVSIHYDLNKNATIFADISSDGGTTWNVATTTLTGHVNTLVTKGNNRAITWNPAIDFSNEEKTSMRIRLSGIDAFGITSAYYESGDFSLDTAAPLGLLSLSKFASTENSATMNWSSDITDASFSHYELWHGANQTDVLNRNNTAQKWSVTEDSNLNAITTISTIITGLNLTSDYFVKIWAVDEYGNEATTDLVNVYSPPVVINYTLDVLASTGSGTVDPAVGSHVYEEGTSVNITATPADGWVFNNWLLDNLAGGSANPFSLVMNANHNIKAVFTEYVPPPPTQKTLTIGATIGGTTNPAVGIHNYDVNSTVNVVATPNDGYRFVRWEENGATLSTQASINVYMSADRSISAFFEEIPVTYDLTIQASTGSGAVDPAVGSHTYAKDASVVITATPVDGWVFDHWTLDGGSGGSLNPLTLTMAAAHTLKATFTEFVPPPPTQNTLTISATVGGTTNPSIGSHNYNVSSTVTVTATADSGYRFVRWERDGAPLSTANSVSVVLSTDVTISAIFELIPVTPSVEVVSTGGGGSVDVTPPGKPILSPVKTPKSVMGSRS